MQGSDGNLKAKTQKSMERNFDDELIKQMAAISIADQDISEDPMKAIIRGEAPDKNFNF